MGDKGFGYGKADIYIGHNSNTSKKNCVHVLCPCVRIVSTFCVQRKNL